MGDNNIDKYQYQINVEVHLIDCNFCNNTSEQNGGAVSIQTFFPFVIDNCKFTENKSNNGGAIFIQTDVIDLSDNNKQMENVLITNCIFEDNSGSESHCIYILDAPNTSIEITSCNFTNNNYNESYESGSCILSNSFKLSISNCNFIYGSSEVECGSLIYMNETDDTEIFDCQFIKCFTSDSLIHVNKANAFTFSNNNISDVNRSIKLSKDASTVLISNNTFERCISVDEGGALYIDGNSTEIIDNNFTECSSNANGLAIYISQGTSMNIHNCIFTNNYLQNNLMYTIFSNSKELTFTDSIIQYDYDHHGCGIMINEPCSGTISNVEFRNLRCPSAIYYDISIDSGSEILTVSNCLFTGFKFSGNSLSNQAYSAFTFGLYSNVIFTNNTVENHDLTNSDSQKLLVGLIKDKIENCRFINNSVSSEKCGGSGLDFNGDSVKLINCYFDDNSALCKESNYERIGGALCLTKPSSVEIEKCTFINNKSDLQGGAIYIGISGASLISNCTFKRNSGDVNGHALCISGEEIRVIVSEFCLFEDNSRNNEGSQIFINENAKLEIENSTFRISGSESESKSRAIELSKGTLNVRSSLFYNIEAFKENSQTEGNAILVSNGSNIAHIEDCRFIDCYMNDQFSYAVTFNGSSLAFIRNTFDFIAKKGCGCLRIYITGDVNILENTFKNAKTPSDFHGVFVYEEIMRISSEFHTVISNNTFDNCASQQTACFQFKWRSRDYEFTNNTFQNNDLENYLGEIDLLDFIDYSFYLIGNNFINNSCRSLYGGCSGLFFNNQLIDNQNNIENGLAIIFEGCNFIGNQAIEKIEYENPNIFRNGKGGAIQQGCDESLKNFNFKIENCLFNGNKAYQEGGAIFLSVQSSTDIIYCQFINNTAGLSENNKYCGRAIAIDRNKKLSPTINIKECIFIGNKADDADSIYVKNAPETDFYITKCQFIENSTDENSHSSISVETRKFEVDDCYFECSSIIISSCEIESNHSISINDCQFNKSSSSGAICFSQTTNSVELFSLTNCEFEDCLGNNASCLLLTFLSDPEFLFKNNVIRYTKEIVSSKYLYSFCFTNKEDITIENVSFIYVTSESLYGGGAGIWITGVKAITFENCIFNNNTAVQSKNGEIRPNQVEKASPYFNGDGGGFQYGYSESLYNTDIEIRNCSFMNNKASRHGGGIAFQTTKTVTIINCLFDGNAANSQNSEESGTSRLLFENYFDRKTEGRGGAIYFNPTFSHINKQDESFMTKVEIVNCTFKSNSAFDGCAIYIEGDDAGTEFIIEQNEFIDNSYSDPNPNSIRKGIITSEIFNLFNGKIETSNEFVITNPLMKEVLYVDHNGNIPTNEFTESQHFTNILPLPTTIHLKPSQKLTQMKSMSLTFTQMRSVSYSISYFKSNTNMISFDQVDSTFIFVETQTNFYAYFPYIIHYLSPLYVQTFVPIIISSKSKITKEQLIGISCGSACAFFLVLGIIILAIQKKNQDKLKYIEYEDISETSEIVANNNNSDDEAETKMNNKITEQFDPNEEEFESDYL